MNNKWLLTTCLFLGILLSQGAKAQEGDYYQNSRLIYQKAKVLYHEGAYGSAEALFQKLMASPSATLDGFKEEADFYSALCSRKANYKDAEFKLLNFINSYPESSFIPVAQFSLGEYYFDHRRYSQALRLFNILNPVQLNKVNRLAFYYKKGFCLLSRKKPEQALALFHKVKDSKSLYASPAAYFSAIIKLRKGDYDEALNTFFAIKDDPRYKRVVPGYIMQVYYQQGHYDKVVAVGKSYVVKVKGKLKTDISRLMANAYFELEDYSNALPFFETYEKLSKKRLSSSEAYRMAYAYLKNQKYPDAIGWFQQATQGNDSLAQYAWYNLAYCYEQTGRMRFAQNAYIKAFEMQSDKTISQESMLAYAGLSVKQKGDPARNAIALVQQFVNDRHYDSRSRQKASSLLVQLYLNSHNNRAALEALEKSGVHGAMMQKIYQQLAYVQAVQFYGQNNFRQAVTYFDKALKYSIDLGIKYKSIYWKADSYYRMHAYARASQYYRKFLTVSGPVSSPLYARAIYDLSYCYFNQKHYATAIRFFQRFLRQQHDRSFDADSWLRLADSYMALGNFANALSWYNKIPANNPNAAYAHYQTAYAYGAQGKFRQKAKSLLSLINAYPHSAYFSKALFDLASTYNSALNEPWRAIVYFDRLVKERPTSDYARKARVKMGLLYYNNNQYDRAIAVLKAVIAVYPASAEAEVALSTLESIYKDQGRLKAYFAYVKTLDFVQVSVSQEDSLTFSVGEDAYVAGNCSKVIKSLNDYLSRFEKGGFVLKAYHYLSECYARKGDTIHALLFYHKIIDFPVNEYSQRALLLAARMEYVRHEYEQADDHYKRLSRLSEDPAIQLECLNGSMHSSFLFGNLADAEKAAHRLLKTVSVSDRQIVYAHFVLAKSALSLNNQKMASREFGIVSRLDKGTLGAESVYQLAKLLFNNKQYDKTEKEVYTLSDQFPDQLYWVARGFILLADVYQLRGNIFQARETLKSVIDNYPGKDLKEVARKKLSRLPNKNQKENDKVDSVQKRK